MWATAVNATSTMMMADTTGTIGGLVAVAIVVSLVVASATSSKFLLKLLNAKSATKRALWNIIIGGFVLGVCGVVYLFGSFAGDVLKPIPAETMWRGLWAVVALWGLGGVAKHLSGKLQENLKKARSK